MTEADLLRNSTSFPKQGRNFGRSPIALPAIAGRARISGIRNARFFGTDSYEAKDGCGGPQRPENATP